MNTESIVYGGRTIPRRPRQSDEYVLSDVFDAIMPELAAECDWDTDKDTTTIEEARTEFINAARFAYDGYAIMRNLERSHSWDGNMQLADIFDDAPFQKCLEKHVQLWIDHFRIEPLFQPGDTVTFRHGGERINGVIESGDPYFEPGRYIIHVECMDGKTVVRWEDCEKPQEELSKEKVQ